MLALPAADSPLRAMFDVADLVAFGTKKAFPPSFTVAKLTAARIYSEPLVCKVSSVCLICIRASGELWLVRFGPKGGHKKLWNFGIL